MLIQSRKDKGGVNALLRLTPLEARDNPSVPDMLGHIPTLVGWSRDWTYASAEDYTETQSLVRSSDLIILEQQAGTGTAGIFSIAITGGYASLGIVTASGNYLEDIETDDGTITIVYASSATGDFSGQIEYSLVVEGRQTPHGIVIDRQTYIESGSILVTRTAFQDQGYSTITGQRNHIRNWSLTWTGEMVNDAWTITAYAFSESNVLTISTRSDIYNGAFIIQDEDYGYETTLVGNGDGTATVDSRQWEFVVKQFTYPNNPTANQVLHEGIGEVSTFGTIALALEPYPVSVEWKASSAQTSNFSWLREARYAEELTQTAVTSPNGWLSVPAFTLNLTIEEVTHRIESEMFPSESGGLGLYQRDEQTSNRVTVTGSGQYGETTSASYRVQQSFAANAETTLTVIGDESTGVDDHGDEYDLVFHAVVDRSSNSEYTSTSDYHDAGAGLVLVNQSLSGSNGATVTTRHWGLRNGLAFDNTSTVGDSDTVSLTGGDDPVADAYWWLTARPGHTLLITATHPDIPQPPTTIVTGLRGGPQKWYNDQVQKIGQDATEKVVKLWIHREVMQRLRNPGNQAILLPGSGTFTVEAKGHTATTWTKDSKAVKHKITEHQRGFKALKYEDIKLLSVDVIISYEVLDADQPFRAGNCVVNYRTIYHYSIKDKQGVTRNVQREGISGIIQFQDDNLKGMQFIP